MKNKTKYFILLLVLLFTFAACDENNTEHFNEIVSKWSVDLENHWCTTENGEITNLQKHDFAEDKCIVCNAIIETQENATVISLYNSNKDIIYSATYDETGSKYLEYVYTATGWQSILLLENGNKQISEFDLHGEQISTIIYDSNDNIKYGYRFENTYDIAENLIHITTFSIDEEGEAILLTEEQFSYTNSGERYISKAKNYQEDGSIYEDDMDEKGNIILMTHYKSDGTFENSWAYEYNTEGSMIRETVYNSDGTINMDTEYEYDANGALFLKYVTIPVPDGEYLLEVYNSSDEKISETITLPDGSQREYKYEYEYDLDGSLIITKANMYCAEIWSGISATDANNTEIFVSVFWIEDGDKCIDQGLSVSVYRYVGEIREPKYKQYITKDSITDYVDDIPNEVYFADGNIKTEIPKLVDEAMQQERVKKIFE